MDFQEQPWSELRTAVPLKEHSSGQCSSVLLRGRKTAASQNIFPTSLWKTRYFLKARFVNGYYQSNEYMSNE